jgi:sugar phosphate isomerase/epimerase
MTAEDLVDRAAALGVPVVQIADNLPLHDRSEAALADLNDRARAADIEIEVGTRGISDANIERHLEIAVRFGSPVLRVVVDDAHSEPSPSEIITRLGRHEDRFRRAGVVLAIENHDRLPSAALAAVVTNLGQEWVGVCLDTLNSLGALESPDVVMDTLGPLTVNLHVKDFTIVRSNATLGFDVRGCPVGAGRLDLDRLLASVSRRMNPLTAVIELWTPRQGSLAATVALESEWAERSVATLTSVLNGDRRRDG